MNSLFGVPMTDIMVALLIVFALCMLVGVWIYLRHRVIFKMGIRNVPRRPAQTILIIIGLMLSTLIMSAAMTTGDTLDNSISGSVFDLVGHTDVLVVLSSGNVDNAGPQPGVTFPQQVATDLQAALAGNDVIEGIMPMLTEPVPVINPRTQQSEPSITLTGIDPSQIGAFGGIDDLDGNPIDLASLPENGIVLGAEPADQLAAQAGDTLTIFVNNQPHQLTVAAIAPDSFLTGTTDPGQAGGFAMPLDRAQGLLNRPGEIGFVAISNKGGIKDGVKHSDEAVQAIDAVLDGTPYRAVPVKQRALELAELAGNAFTSIFVVLGLFSIAAGILLIFLIFVLLAAERKPEMGMARAVGLKRRQLTQMFLAEGIAYNLVSALIGAALGVAVAFAMAEVLTRLIGEFIEIRPTASVPGLVIAYTLGVIVTFITISISSWRVSRLNIVAAIRDIPEPQKQRTSRRWLVFGILGVLLGALLMWAGTSSGQLFPYSIGISLIPLSLAVALRSFGVPARPLYTVASLLVLSYWLLPESLAKRIFPELTGNMEMFFVSGIMMVAAATMAIIWNAEILTSFVGLLGRTFSKWLPAVKTAVAYPTASKGRTGMTIAMFSLIIFSLVMMATINANFVAIFTSDEADAGWDITASQPPTNTIEDFRQTLASNGFDTGKLEEIGRVETMPQSQVDIRLAGTEDWKSYTVNGVDQSFIQNGEMPLKVRATGYDSDQAIWDAVAQDPNLIVIDGFSIPGQTFVVGGPTFQLTSVGANDETMQPTQVEIRNPANGETKTLTIIGVIDTKVSMLFGVYMQQATFTDLFEQPSSITYYIQTASGVDIKETAQQIEASLITFGVQAESIPDLIKQQAGQSQGFLYLIEGFMGLGLLVGIAALGVISFRSVVERRQQIGMLRAIGYQRGMVAASFLIESSMITFLGVASGLALGLTLAYQLMTSEEFSGTTGGVDFVVPWFELAAFVIISIGAALLMAYIPSRKAASVPIADALRYE